jgi:hypothetical protein
MRTTMKNISYARRRLKAKAVCQTLKSIIVRRESKKTNKQRYIKFPFICKIIRNTPEN